MGGKCRRKRPLSQECLTFKTGKTAPFNSSYSTDKHDATVLFSNAFILASRSADVSSGASRVTSVSSILQHRMSPEHPPRLCVSPLKRMTTVIAYPAFRFYVCVTVGVASRVVVDYGRQHRKEKTRTRSVRVTSTEGTAQH
ncbi:unnamed protein product [Sphenostylis stenocarpa]|uniref:Uncharacterized protein n=1 Tax=Sphenostylis stenocarpa TaxID=92480 RepID=A0AA86W1K0_9FABA|nr:unnamed protein product [Sphenostylis stenocarpa]